MYNVCIDTYIYTHIYYIVTYKYIYIYNVPSWFVCTPPSPPLNKCYTLFKVWCQKTPPQKKYDPAFQQGFELATIEIQLKLFFADELVIFVVLIVLVVSGGSAC